MSLATSFLGMVHRPCFLCYEPLSDAWYSRWLLIRSCLLAILSSALFALHLSADFIAARSYPAGRAPAFLVVGDFNGDGILDFAVSDFGDGTASRNGAGVSILLGKGDGTFQAPQMVSPESGPLVVADFNRDGFLDLAVVGDGRISVLLGNGNGTFQSPVTTPAGSLASSQVQLLQGYPAFPSVAVGDFNGDGYPDLVLAGLNSRNNRYELAIFLANGDGTFQQAQDYAVGAVRRLAVGDFNADGRLDIAVAAGNQVSILLGNGDGTFQGDQGYTAGPEPSFMAVGDFNGDGFPDLAVTNDNGTVSVLIGNGDGTFQNAHSYTVSPNLNLVFVAAGDLSGNGHLDLAVASSTGTVTVLKGNGDGTFQAARSYAGGSAGNSIALGDFNHDGHLDVAVASQGALSIGYTDGSVVVMLGNGDGTLQAARSYPVGLLPSSVAVGDFNGDGIPDLVVANGFTEPVGSLSVLLGNGDGTFRVGTTFATEVGPNFVAVGDFNGDGKLDIVTTNYYDGNPPRNPRGPFSEVSVWLGNGDGTFHKPIIYRSNVLFTSVAVADFNGDGIPDLAVSIAQNFVSQGNVVSIMLGNGDGTFKEIQSYTFNASPFSLTVGDFNGDGIPDIVTGSGSILLGNGDGTFKAGQDFAPHGFLAVGDFNGDGILDLAVVSNGMNILLGNGDGTFRTAGKYVVGVGVPAVADFNGDGILDLAVADGPGVSILSGNGDGSFQPAQNYTDQAGSLTVADFDGDGLPDIAGANEQSNTVTVLINGR